MSGEAWHLGIRSRVSKAYPRQRIRIKAGKKSMRSHEDKVGSCRTDSGFAKQVESEVQAKQKD